MSSKTMHEEIISPEEALKIFEPIQSLELENFHKKIILLKNSPPQLLHLEGGNIFNRMAFAYYWAALHICQNQKPMSLQQEIKNKISFPCLNCQDCIKIAANVHSDIVIFDGREESIKVESMRDLKIAVSEPPRYAPKRVVILIEAQKMTTEASNTLLKVLEEPSSHTLFIFTIPQRQNLLPTLISRGFVLTLPWISANDSSEFETKDKLLKELEEELNIFFKNGNGFLEKISAKGFMTNLLAKQLILIIQKNMVNALAGKNTNSSLSKILHNININLANQIIANAEEALFYQANPTYTMNTMFTSLYNIIKN